MKREIKIMCWTVKQFKRLIYSQGRVNLILKSYWKNLNLNQNYVK